jgi:hypothetical protein
MSREALCPGDGGDQMGNCCLLCQRWSYHDHGGRHTRWSDRREKKVVVARDHAYVPALFFLERQRLWSRLNPQYDKHAQLIPDRKEGEDASITVLPSVGGTQETRNVGIESRYRWRVH